MFSVKECCVKNGMASRVSYQFLTINLISVMAMIYGNTTLLQTSNQHGVGSRAWSRYNMNARTLQCAGDNQQVHRGAHFLEILINNVLERHVVQERV
jgi:hypothetical protein